MPIYGSRSSSFVAPPIFEVPRGSSLGAGLSEGIGEALAGYMRAQDEEDVRLKAEEEADIVKQMEAEALLLELAPILSMFEKGGIESLTGAPLEPGNIDLRNRPRVPNPEGGISTLLSMGIGDDKGVETIVPRVKGGRILSPDDARAAFADTGEHLGKFGTVEDANLEAERLHRGQEAETGDLEALIDSLSGAPEGVPGKIPLGTTRFAEPLLDEITLPTGEKVSVPPVRGRREQLEAEAGAEATFEMRKGTEVLSPEVLKLLPKEFQARWQPEQRVPSDELNEIIMELVGREEETTPWSKPYEDEGQSYQYNEKTGAVRLTPGVTTEIEKPEKARWVTVTDLETGRRVRITETEWNTAPEGTFSDIKPAQPRGAASAKGRAEARDAALVFLGGPDDKDPNSVWTLATRWTFPGPSGIVGPFAKAGGMAAAVAGKFGIGPSYEDIALYNSQVEGFIPLLARAVGHTGVLTEKDVVRTRRLLPVISSISGDTDTQRLALRKLERVRRIMSGKEAMPAGMFSPQEGHWPPPGGVSAASPISPGMNSLMQEYGGPGG